MDIDKRGVEEFAFDGVDVRIVKRATNETLERANGVSKVGSFLGLCRLTNGALLGAKANEGTRDKCLRGERERERKKEKETHGVARLETSLVMISTPRRRATPI